MEGITRTEVIEAAREFGEALANCEECRAFQEAQQAFTRDGEAQKLLSNYQFIQRSIRMSQMQGKKMQKDELMRLKDLDMKIRSNQTINNLLNAQTRLQDMLRNLNNEISDLLEIDFAANSGIGGCC